MNFLRALLASLLSLVCTLAVSGFVTLQTLNATVLDRTEVKAWLNSSGVYNKLLDTTIVNSPELKQEFTAAAQSVVTTDDLMTALNMTFDASYVKQGAEDVIDGTYNWLDGKSNDITFEVNTTDKKEAFIANLSTVLEPQLAQLPTCTSILQFQTNNPPCLPPGTTAKQAADRLAVDAANQASIFRQPINNDTLAQTQPSQTNPLTDNRGMQQFRDLVGTLRDWLVWLPLIAVGSGLFMVLLSRLHFKAAKHLAGRLTLGLLVTCVIGLIIAHVGKNLSISNYYSSSNVAVTSNIVEPILHQAVPAIGNYLALVSGIAGTITFVLWIILRIIYKRREQAKLLAPPEDTAATPPTSATPQKPEGPSSAPPTAPSKTSNP